jgi:acetolactate synthase I/II/III large subunit
METTGAEYVIRFLIERGVRRVAGMPGGAILPLYDALARSALAHVLVRHEQAAGFIAQGAARASGKAQVCFATSGPGATNLLTALADARMDSVPVVAITGQVPTALLGTDAFQEVDIVAAAKPVVKHAELVRSAAELPGALERAFELATSGRPGPVLVDIPKDVQQARLPQDAPRHTPRARPWLAELRDADIDRVIALLEAAERPVLYVGGGVIQAGASEFVGALARMQDLAVTCTLMGLGAFDPRDPRYLGMLGMHGAPYTNLILHECDLLFAVGARFDDRATGKLSEFCPRARVIHVDIDAREIGKLKQPLLGIQQDARAFLQRLVAKLPARARPEYRAHIEALRGEQPLPALHGAAREVFRALSAAIHPGVTLTTDVGQHQMWLAQHVPIQRPRQLLTSGGLGSMGFGLPAAIGAALETQGRVWCVTGDGSLLLNIHELATLSDLGLDVAIIVLDNQHLGLVRQQQTLFYEARLSAAAFARATDFVAIARAFGLAAAALSDADAIAVGLPALLAQRGPRLIHVPIAAAEMVLPMVAPGAGNHRMVLAAGEAPARDG